MARAFLSFPFTLIALLIAPSAMAGPWNPPVTFNTNFEGASIGQIEVVPHVMPPRGTGPALDPPDETTFRCHIEGQTDERGHNRQGSWFFFRMDHVRNRDIVLTLVYFGGEYNGKPAKGTMAAGLNPVFSNDGVHWQHFPAMAFDEATQEATLRFRPTSDSIWLAHIPPYTPADLKHLLADVDRCPDARIEVIGKSVRGRELVLVTVTDAKIPDTQKKVVWLIARQHAWESGTSHVMEGALHFVTSNSPEAATLREKTIFKFSPMVDVDGSATGKVRFNANGYDVNRHWDAVDLRHKESLNLMPEIWCTKKAILAQMAGRDGHGIDLMVNMHNTETSEYLDTQVDDAGIMKSLTRLDDLLTANTQFDPSSKIMVRKTPLDTTNVLWPEAHVPVALMEQRIGPSKKLGRQPTVEDRLAFGAQLIKTMAQVALEETPK